MTHFQSIQELYSFEGSEASPMIADKVENYDLLLPQLHKIDKRNNSIVISPGFPLDESPTIDTSSPKDIDAAIKKNQRCIKDALIVYKQLKHFEFFQKFKQKFSKDLRATEALINLCKAVKYEYYLPNSVIYRKGDLSNQKVYLVYSGEVESWVGKPEACGSYNVRGRASVSRKKDNSISPNNSLFEESNSFGGQSSKIHPSLNKQNTKLRRINSTKNPSFNTKNSSIRSLRSVPKQSLNKQFTFEEGLVEGCSDISHIEKLPFLNQYSLNGQLLGEELNTEDFNLNEILNFKTPPRPIKGIGSEDEIPSQMKVREQKERNKSPVVKTLNDFLSTDFKSVNEGFSENNLSTENTIKKSKKSLSKLEPKNRLLDDSEQDSRFILRKTKFLKSKTLSFNMDQSQERKGGDDGYVKATVTKGGHFGDEVLSTNQPRKETMITSTACELIVFTVDDYEYLMTRFQRENTQVLDFLLDYVPGLEEIMNRRKNFKPDSYFQEETYNLHNHITIEGTKGTKIFMLYEGTGKVLKNSKGPVKDQAFRKPYPSSNEVVICVIKPGVFIGEEVLFNQEGEYEYTVKASSSVVKVLAIEGSVFKEAMPKLAYSGLESLHINKRQKNMEIMNTKVEFSKGRNKLQRFPSFESTKNEELSILSHNNPPPQEHRKVKLDVPLENKRYSRVKHLALKPYSVELAIQGSHGPQLLEGFKFMKTPHYKENLENIQAQGNVNTEKEKLEEVPKLTENEKKLQRYLANAGNKKEERMIKRLETKEARLKNASPAPDDSLKSVVKGIERLRLVSRNQKREIKITERSNERETMNKHARKVFEGFSGKKLDELFAFISPRREKFVGFMPFDKQKNNICSFNKCAPSSERSHSSNIKVEVDMQTKKITYGVGNIKTGQHMSARSQASSDSNSMKNTFFSVKTASVSRNSKPIKENKSGRRVSSRIETPEPSSFGLDLESEMRQPSRFDAQPKLPKLPLQTKISSR